MQKKLAAKGRRMVTIVASHIKRDDSYHSLFDFEQLRKKAGERSLGLIRIRDRTVLNLLAL
ncbi:unnamed protein product, partial [Brassica oleracea]